MARNRIFLPDVPEPALSRKQRWIDYGLIFCLISAATGTMMLCPCDVVGVHDRHALSLVGLAAVFAVAAAVLVYRRMERDAGITGFLRAAIALAIVGACVYAELFLAMEWVALRAGR